MPPHTPPLLATPDLSPRVGAIIGAAFADDPVVSWTLGAPATITHTFTTLARLVYVPHGLSFLVDDAGAAMWLRPGGSKAISLPGMATIGWAITRHSGVRHVPRALRVDDDLLRRKPKSPHYYLFAIGVLPEAQGRGLGRSLLTHTLAEADEARSPAYLESSNPVNEPLYRSVGFEVVDRFHPAPGCPSIAAMWREPR